MKPKEMTIFVSRTFQLQRFESLKVEAGMTVSIDEGDDLAELRPQMLAEIRKSLSAAYRANHPSARNRSS